MQADVSMRLTPSMPFGSDQHKAIERELRAEAQQVRYHGDLGTLARLFYKNLALTILSLGFYRFWGKTQIRRYVWSQVEVLGERLEYLGTGKELLLGFLKTGLFIAILVVAREALPEVLDPLSLSFVVSSIAISATFGLLFLAAHFAAQRYRLSRTSWCGIHGGMEGSGWAYALRAGGLFIICALLAGLLIPWWRMQCLDMRTSASRLGSMRATLEAGRGVCFWTFMLGSLILSIANLAIGITLAKLAVYIDPAYLSYATVGITIILLLFVAPFAFAPYYASVQHEFLNNLSLYDGSAGYVRFYSAITAGGVLWQLFTAALLLLPTLGLAFPLVMHRWLQYSAGNIRITGNIERDKVRQASEAMPKASEGLLEALDPGIL